MMGGRGAVRTRVLGLGLRACGLRACWARPRFFRSPRGPPGGRHVRLLARRASSSGRYASLAVLAGHGARGAAGEGQRGLSRGGVTRVSPAACCSSVRTRAAAPPPAPCTGQAWGQCARTGPAPARPLVPPCPGGGGFRGSRVVLGIIGHRSSIRCLQSSASDDGCERSALGDQRSQAFLPRAITLAQHGVCLLGPLSCHLPLRVMRHAWIKRQAPCVGARAPRGRLLARGRMRAPACAHPTHAHTRAPQRGIRPSVSHPASHARQHSRRPPGRGGRDT